MIESFENLTPVIDPTAWVHPSAVVIGEVELGPGVSVWPTTVLRGDMGRIVVGEHTNLQDGVICHDTGNFSETLVGCRVTVGHRAILHGCIVEDDCLIGMGAIVMDNARIGAGSIIGAGAIVTVNKIIPPGSLVLGAPGKVVRAVTDKDRRHIDGAWRIYLKKCEIWRTRV